MTKAFLISYDLKQPGRDYTSMYEAIKKGRNWWHFLESVWIVATAESAAEIWTALHVHMDRNDYLLIIEVRDNVQGWLPKDAWDWIHQNVPKP